jgi:hypothetical protein
MAPALATTTLTPSPRACAAAFRTPASEDRSQSISWTVAPNRRASPATAAGARPTSTSSGGCGRAAIARVAERPRPRVRPVINTVVMPTRVANGRTVRQSPGCRRTSRARTTTARPLQTGRVESWEFGRTVRRWRDRVVPGRRRCSGRPAPPGDRTAPRGTGRPGRHLGRLPDPARAGPRDHAVGPGRGGAGPCAAPLVAGTRPALPSSVRSPGAATSGPSCRDPGRAR